MLFIHYKDRVDMINREDQLKVKVIRGKDNFPYSPRQIWVPENQTVKDIDTMLVSVHLKGSQAVRFLVVLLLLMW